MAWFDWWPPSGGDFKRLENKVATLTEALTQVKADYGRIAAAVDNIKADEKRQDEKIAELQKALEAKGNLTPEEKALLDEVVSLSSANTASVEALAASIPEPPVVTPPTT